MTNIAEFRPVTQQHDKVLIVGGGESLVDFDLARIKDFDGAVITVNNVIDHIPRADYWITVDPMSHGKPQEAMLNKKEGTYYYCAYPDVTKNPFDGDFYHLVNGVHYLERIVPINYEDPKIEDGYKLQEDKDKITTGDSCYGALGLAYHFGATKIVMLGVDAYGFGHWYNKIDPYNKGWGKKFTAHLDRLPIIYANSVEQLKERGVKVAFGSPDSPIKCFGNMTPDEAFVYFDK